MLWSLREPGGCARLGLAPQVLCVPRAGPASISGGASGALCRAGKSSSRRRSSDIISLLVSIYGSKDLFINEYRSLLADRLLHQFSFSPER